MIIQDPRNGQGAYIDDDGRLNVLADMRPNIARASLEGDSIAIHSTYSATAAQEVFGFQNDDPVPFYVESVFLGTDTAGSLTVAVSTGTLGGTPVVGSSLNRGKSITRLYTAYGNASVTGLTPGAALGQVFLPASGSGGIGFASSLVLGNGDQICVTTNVTAAISCTLYGYWAE